MSARGYNRETRVYRLHKQDVKAITRRLDEDVASRYDYEDDETSSTLIRQAQPRYAQNSSRNEGYGVAKQGLPIPRTKQIIRSAPGKREIVLQFFVKGAARTGRDSVLKSLASSVNNFKPIAPNITPDGDLEFFLTNQEVGDAVKAMTRRIVDKKNPSLKLNIIMRRLPATWDPLKREIKEAIQAVVQSRYSPTTNSLDLTEFGTDKIFTDAKYNCALFRNEIMVYVADLIEQNYDFITGLSLKGNRLRSLNFTSTLIFRAPKVKELDLSNNGLSRIEELEKLKGWPIEQLHLENNELCNKYGNDASAYTSAVHTIFPRVTYLDGIAVARNPFLFPDEDEVLQMSKLPPFKLGFTQSPELRQLVEKFLTEYYAIYDGPEGAVTRQQLFAAYDANATFSYAITTIPDTVRVLYANDETYSTYIKSSHNIMQEMKWERYREKIVYRGAMDVANCISKLPLTNHIMDSFILDITLVTQELMCFTLQGLLRDGPDAFSTKEGDVKFFCRSFVVLPRPENKIAIINDMLQLSPIVVGRMIRYKSLITKANEIDTKPGPSGIQGINQITLESKSLSSAPPPSPSQQPVYDKNDPTIQQAMIDQFSQQSGMKHEWARQCLSDQNWDFEAAGKRFWELRESIPPEAFINPQ